MVIDKAIYKTYSKKTVIKANKMTPEEYQNIYKGHLYCITQNCNARLIHVQVEKNKKAYFKTLQGDNHSDNCPNRFDRDAERGRYVYSYTEEGLEFSESHVKEVLKDTYAKMNGKLKITTTTPIRSERKKSSKVINGKDKNISKEVYISGGKVGNKSGKRQPPICKKTIKEFLDAKIGTYSVYGYLSKIDFTEGQAYLTIQDNNKNLRLYMGNIFIRNSEKEFKLLQSNLKYIDFNDIKLVVICHKTFHGEEVIGELVDYKTMLFNGFNFYKFLKKIKDII